MFRRTLTAAIIALWGIGLPSIAFADKYCNYVAVREVWVNTTDHKLKSVLLKDGILVTKVIATYSATDVRANAELDHKLSLLTSALLAGKAIELRYANGYDCNLVTDDITEPKMVILHQ